MVFSLLFGGRHVALGDLEMVVEWIAAVLWLLSGLLKKGPSQTNSSPSHGHCRGNVSMSHHMLPRFLHLIKLFNASARV